MGTYRVAIFLSPKPGREAEFHEWYEQTHLGDVLRTAGFTAAQRFGVGAEFGAPTPGSHLAFYETEGDSAAEVLERLAATRDERPMIDAIDASNAAIWVLEPLGERHVAHTDT